MGFDPASPAQTHNALTDIGQIRENLNQLRSLEQGSLEPSNPAAGMLWLYTPATGDWILRQRDKDNIAWIDLYYLTAAGSPQGHFNLNTQTVSVHGAKQGEGNGFDSDMLDGRHYSDLITPYTYLGESGDDIFLASDVEVAPLTDSYVLVKVKEFTLNQTPSTDLKIRFDYRSSDGSGYPIYVKLIRERAGVQTVLYDSGAYYSTAWVVVSNIYSGWQNGDLIQLWAAHRGGAAANCRVKNFRLLGLRAIAEGVCLDKYYP